MKIYLASSWRNQQQPEAVQLLRCAGHEVYDFKNPKPGDDGFHWSELDHNWKSWTPREFTDYLEHPIAQSGFKSDYDAMEWAECGVLLLPCGRSAHLEAGYFVGANKLLHIVLSSDGFEPELMYKMATVVHVNIKSLIRCLG